jgi:hypothetical protein
MIGAGRFRTGGCALWTITWKLPVVTSGGVALSLAVHCTVVVPTGNVLPDGGVQLTVGELFGSSGRLAVTV